MEKKYYYWLLKRIDDRLHLVYGGETEEEAQQRGLELLGAEFGIKRLPTKSLALASSYIKGNVLEDTRDLRIASRRLKHKLRRRKE